MEISLSELISLLNQNTSLVVREVMKELVPIFELEVQKEKIHNMSSYETENSSVRSTNIGENIRQMRVKKGLTQEKLAQNLGISQSMIGHIESGRKSPSISLVIDISKELDCTMNDICRE